mmetsp:Transcript_1720/g.3096  ORF Transcript_1720/g.3096 Transcript_1720/m.3096 type:complete len:234 (+) Transcript_1720:728-1429(+)
MARALTVAVALVVQSVESEALLCELAAKLFVTEHVLSKPMRENYNRLHRGLRNRSWQPAMIVNCEVVFVDKVVGVKPVCGIFTIFTTLHGIMQDSADKFMFLIHSITQLVSKNHRRSDANQRLYCISHTASRVILRHFAAQPDSKVAGLVLHGVSPTELSSLSLSSCTASRYVNPSLLACLPACLPARLHPRQRLPLRVALCNDSTSRSRDPGLPVPIFFFFHACMHACINSQ